MERWKTIGFLSILAFMISSWQTTKMYAGPELPASEIAIITDDKAEVLFVMRGIDIVIDFVDGAPVENERIVSKIAVKPGCGARGRRIMPPHNNKFSSINLLWMRFAAR